MREMENCGTMFGKWMCVCVPVRKRMCVCVVVVAAACLVSLAMLPRPVVRQQRKSGYASWGSMSLLGN